MPDYRRAHAPGGTFFFTVNTYRRQTFLTDADVRSAPREAIGTIRLTHPFLIEAWVLLPDHMHALWTLPPGDEDFSHRWRVIKRRVTQRCQTRLNRPEWMNGRRKKRNQSTLWQHRFWEHPRGGRLQPAYRLHSLEPGEAWIRGTGEPLAVFELPSVCQTRVAASTLGKKRRITQRR